MNKKYLYLAFAACALCTAPSCSKHEEPSVEVEHKETKPTYMATISLSGTFAHSNEDELRAVLKPTDKDKIQIVFSEAELMKDGPNIDPKTAKKTRVMNTETGKLTLFFVNSANLGTVTRQVVSPTDFRKNADNTYTIEYTGAVQLSGGGFNSGEWYVSGGYRLETNQNANGTPVGATFVDPSGNIQHENGRTDFKLPFVFGWTKISTKATAPTEVKKDAHGQKFGIKLKPDGYFLRVRILNNLVEDINLSGMIVRSNNMSYPSGSNTEYPLPTITNVKSL